MSANGVHYSGHWSTHQLTEYFSAVSTPDAEEDVLRVAVERAGECLEAEIGAVVLDGRIAACVGFGAGGPREEIVHLPLGVSQCDVSGMSDLQYLTARTDGPGSLSSAVGGRIVVGRFGEPFAPEEEQMVRAMATVLGLVLRNLRSLAIERARQSMLRSLLEVQRAISTRRPLQEVLDAVTGATSGLLGVATASLVLRSSSDDGSLHVASRHGHTDRLDDPLRDASVAVAAAQLAVARGAVTTAEDVVDSASASEIVAVPVHLNAEMTGALVVWKAGWGQASGMHTELLTMFAQQVSVAITDAHTMAKMHEALHDSLTGLATRSLLNDLLGHACLMADRRTEPLCLLFVDLDGFKAVNDTHGHAAGDHVLVEVSRRLRRHLRASDTAARLGGDEFVVVLENTAPHDARTLAARLLTAINQPMEFDGNQIVVGASIGIASAPLGGSTPTDLLAAADGAMYQAKRSGKGRVAHAELTRVRPEDTLVG